MIDFNMHKLLGTMGQSKTKHLSISLMTFDVTGSPCKCKPKKKQKKVWENVF